MKSFKFIAVFAVGLLLTSTVGFASDGTKTTKDCYQDTEYPEMDAYSYVTSVEMNVVAIHSFDYAFVAYEFLAPGIADEYEYSGHNNSNEFGTLAGLFILDNRFTKFPDTDYWLRYKKDLNFKLTYKYTKAPKCDYTAYRC
jgi:hypothetical protein